MSAIRGLIVYRLNLAKNKQAGVCRLVRKERRKRDYMRRGAREPWRRGGLKANENQMNCVHSGFLLDRFCAEASFAHARSKQKTSAFALVFIGLCGGRGITCAGAHVSPGGGAA
jgi:hypothetical protein